MKKTIAAKRKAFKVLKTGKGTRTSYDAVKRIARHAVHHARQETDKKVYENIDPKSSEAYPLANQFRREPWCCWWQTDEEWCRGDVNEWRLKAEGLFRALPKGSQCWVWLNPDHLSDEAPVEGPPIPITIDMVKKAISHMKTGKALGPSDIVVEMIWAAGDTGASMIHDLAAAIIHSGKVPSDGEQNFIVCLYNRVREMHWKGETTGVPSWQSRPWKSWRRFWMASVGVNQWFPIWLCPRQRYNRCSWPR